MYSPSIKTSRARIPSWLLSLGLHGLLFLGLASTLPGLRGGIVGDPAGDFRKIGIYVGHSGNGDDAETGEQKPSAEHPPALPLPAIATREAKPTEKTQTAQPHPHLTPAVIGLAPRADKSEIRPAVSTPIRALESSASGTSATANRPGLISGTDRRGGSGPRGSWGTTPFFGLLGTGGKFVYVIDCSGSMFGHKSMQAAKSEMLSSLQTLKRAQEFQIIFYNLKRKWMTAPGRVDCRFFVASETNRRAAAQFVAEIQPDDGTDHLPALKLALDLHPDVIFFLTDGGDPGLNPSELAEIRRLNKGRSRIHCVRFDTKDEPVPAPMNFVHTLAAENGGDYVCRNVKRFAETSVSLPDDVSSPESSSIGR